MASLVISDESVAKDFVEGVDYVQVKGIPEAKSPVVREFFSYNCSHCYRQDPIFEEAVELLGDKIDFVRTPVGGGRSSWVLSQQAYYLAQKFKMTRQVHGNIFKRIHEKEGPFTRSAQLKEFFVQQGADASAVEQAMNSVDAKLAISHYDTQAQLAGIRGVPSLLVNGKYLIVSKSRTPEELADLVNYLSALKAAKKAS
ncbi:thiol:disulfide interchange protein DsbA/DsbL [Shewanella violacea]|uniref:Thiol:disulfide interchange protein n=1 Tax=Shewanella violacea (strain JCM 10179 / CIP 106290 / LMG 19151 / DSS12) TaxID=637905 RepID=D4ZIY9_SHEVD|nr:thiol:disulfide interchange protein DsbA/DsbL [Shewanella violacea]BAJ01638.1 thiol:disulfide interchange protein DsbA [Shewanella violacea DSS12]